MCFRLFRCWCWYRVMSDLSKEILEEEFNKCGLKDYEIVYMESVDSTNVFAMNNADSGMLKSIVVANCQTAGKGRLGRSFESSRGKGIYATLVVRPQKKAYEIASITLVVAVAVIRAFDKLLGMDTKIKWPNDIILNGKKLCGILTEMKNDGEKVKYVAVGFGINVTNEEFPEEIKDKATSIYLETGNKLERKKILAAVVKEFEELYGQYLENEDLSFMLKEYNERLINRDSEIVVEYKGEKKTATQLGIDKTGVLKVLMDGEEKSIASGEILVRGVFGYV